MLTLVPPLPHFGGAGARCPDEVSLVPPLPHFWWIIYYLYIALLLVDPRDLRDPRNYTRDPSDCPSNPSDYPRDPREYSKEYPRDYLRKLASYEN